MGVELLKMLDVSELVFAQNRCASVLCDGNGSCAMPGHMIVYNGVPMSMLMYCNGVAAAMMNVGGEGEEGVDGKCV